MIFHDEFLAYMVNSLSQIRLWEHANSTSHQSTTTKPLLNLYVRIHFQHIYLIYTTLKKMISFLYTTLNQS